MFKKRQRVYIPDLDQYGRITIVHEYDMYTIELDSGMIIVRYAREIEAA